MCSFPPTIRRPQSRFSWTIVFFNPFNNFERSIFRSSEIDWPLMRYVNTDFNYQYKKSCRIPHPFFYTQDVTHEDFVGSFIDNKWTNFAHSPTFFDSNVVLGGWQTCFVFIIFLRKLKMKNRSAIIKKKTNKRSICRNILLTSGFSNVISFNLL